jgi:signal transduction histidine kinase
MKIATKITFSFLLLIVLIMVVAISVMHVVGKRYMTNAIFAHLISTSEARADYINKYLEMHEVIVNQLSESIILEEFLSTSREAPDYAERFEIAAEGLKRTQEANINLFYECFVLSLEGKIVASSNRASVGLDRAGDDYFLGAKKEVYIKDAYYSKCTKQPTLTFSAPITNHKTKEFLGVVVNKVSLSSLDEITADRTGLGKTGETYLVNKNGYMLTQSRFVKNAPLELAAVTLGRKEALQQAKKFHLPMHKHEPLIFKNYRGIEVLGVCAYISQMQWCLLAEMDKGEALAPLRRLNFVLIALMLLIPVLTWLVGRLIARLIAKPIYRLRRGTEIVGQGDLNYKVGMKTDDEIGDLSRAFDEMTGNLKKTTTSIADLELEVIERKKAEGEAKKAAEVKSEFTSMVSHELRTPLTVIKEGIIMTLDGLAGPLNNEQREFLIAAKRNADRLTRLINNILDFQKLESGKVSFNIKKDDINEVVRGVQKEMAYQAKEKGLDFILKLDEKLLMIRFDRDKIVQVLMNLINNSVKFTDKGSITISTVQEGSVVRVSIKDTGAGIEKKEMPKLFHKFEQLTKFENRKTGGSGLGLAISKEIIAAHKGKIWAESEPGRGATFHFVLPVKERMA